MRLQQLLSYTRKAIDEYQMIDEGDRIAVGISGGKDSLTLLYALQGLRRFYPKHFELEAVTVDLGFENLDLSRIGPAPRMFLRTPRCLLRLRPLRADWLAPIVLSSALVVSPLVTR